MSQETTQLTSEDILYGRLSRKHQSVGPDGDDLWSFPSIARRLGEDYRQSRSLSYINGSLKNLETIENNQFVDGTMAIERMSIGLDTDNDLWVVNRMITDHGCGRELYWGIYNAKRGSHKLTRLRHLNGYPKIDNGQLLFECEYFYGRRPVIRIDSDHQVWINGGKLRVLT